MEKDTCLQLSIKFKDQDKTICGLLQKYTEDLPFYSFVETEGILTLLTAKVIDGDYGRRLPEKELQTYINAFKQIGDEIQKTNGAKFSLFFELSSD